MANEHIDQLILILGKRLVSNRLTDEGVSRVVAAVDFLKQPSSASTAVGFCGGVSANQTIPEAMALFAEFRRQSTHLTSPLCTSAFFFDITSGNTIQNMENISRELLESGLIQKGDSLKIRLVSSDYHLERIIKIQQQMDEQGLPRILKEKGRSLGIDVTIPYNLSSHIVAPYPYMMPLGHIYTQVDRLTIYRVYLEGIVASVFTGNLDEIRKAPYDETVQAINEIRKTISQNSDFLGRRPPVIESAVTSLEEIINKTNADTLKEDVVAHLAFYDSILTMLNQYVDPERTIEGKWWRN